MEALKDIEQIKSFLIWAKKQKIKHIKVGELDVEFSELDYLPETSEEDVAKQLKEITDFESKTMVDTEDMTQEDMDELMYWSSGSKPRTRG